MKKVLALVLAFALVACAALALAEEEVKVQTAEEYLALEDGELVCIETYAQAHEGWWKDDAGVGQCSIYAQDETCGYFIYNAPCSEEDAAKLVDGQKIRVTGTKMVWNGLVEIGNVKSLEILEGDPFVAETKDVTDLFGSEDIEQYMNQKVSFKGLTVAAKKKDDSEVAFFYNWDGSGEAGSDLYFDVTLNGETLTFTVESYLCGKDSDVYKAVEGLKIGDVIDCEGFLYWYEQPHITSLTVVTPAE